jgi:mRNA-degrading endonuclease toxin of MazEF toxin-antitoxin module
MSNFPLRGDVINTNFNMQRGPIEIQKVRPALVLSPSTFNKLNNTAVVCPLTTKERKSEFHVEIESGDVGEVYTKDVRGGGEHSFIVANLFTTMEWEPSKLSTKNWKDSGNIWCYLNEDVVNEVSRLVDSILNQIEEDPDFIPLQGAVVNIEGILPSERQSALVLSASELNYWKRLFTICPISSSRESDFAVEIPDTNEYVLADQVHSWDWWSRKAEFRCFLPDSTFEAVRKTVRSIIWGTPS